MIFFFFCFFDRFEKNMKIEMAVRHDEKFPFSLATFFTMLISKLCGCNQNQITTFNF